MHNSRTRERSCLESKALKGRAAPRSVVPFRSLRSEAGSPPISVTVNELCLFADTCPLTGAKLPAISRAKIQVEVPRATC